MISYYGSLAAHYPANKLKKLVPSKSYLYLLCYISKRMQKFSDNIMNTFVFYVDRYVKSAKAYGKQCVYEEKIGLSKDIKHNVPKILNLFVEQSTLDIAIKEEALKILPESNIKKVISYLSGDLIDEQAFRWKQYINKQAEIIKNLRPIFMSLDFNCDATHLHLDEAIKFLRYYFEKKTPLSRVPYDKFPIAFIPVHQIKYVVGLDEHGRCKSVDHRKYEFCVYWRIREMFKRNMVTVADSITHKSLEADLVPKHRKKSVIKGLENTLLSTPLEKSMHEAQESLDALYYQVNKRIDNKDNDSVRVETQGENHKLILSYNNKEDLANHSFFKKLTKISIIDLLYFVNKSTGFLNLFTHIKPHESKSVAEDTFILGALIANGTYQSLANMANMSNLDYQSLLNADHNFIRLDTIKATCDWLSDAISQLPIFSDWNIRPDMIHAGVDGQKFETRIDVLLARNSSKYFPLKKGVVAYSLLANFIPLSAETISPNIHESYFLFDILKNQTTNIKIDSVSGDSHSINPVNFLLMQYLPIEFAPHLVNINNKIRNLHSLTHPREFKDLLIKPRKLAKSEFILSEEENINWVIASLLHGDVRQNVIVKKLSSFAKYNRTCKAMASYNRIFESTYTLNYIDRPCHRQYVRESLNRIEAYHQMRRAITRANGGELRGGSEIEVMIWNECSRLLSLAIIYYNARLLTALLKKYQKAGDSDAVEIIKRISPIAWIHLLLSGKFEFILQPPDIDIDDMVRDIEL